MSIQNNCCDLCGVSANPRSCPDAYWDTQSGRLWCGLCHTEVSVRDIAAWLYLGYPWREPARVK